MEQHYISMVTIFSAGSDDTLKEFYERHLGFKGYVDKYCRKYGIGVKTAFTHAVIRNVCEYYKAIERDKGQQDGNKSMQRL